MSQKVKILASILGAFLEPEPPLYSFWGGLGPFWWNTAGQKKHSFLDAYFFDHIAEHSLQNGKISINFLVPFLTLFPRCVAEAPRIPKIMQK